MFRKIYLEPGQAFLVENKTLIIYRERKDLSSPCTQCYYYKKALPCYSDIGLLDGRTHVYCDNECCFEESEEGL